MKPRPVSKLRGALEQRLTAYAMAASASGIGLLLCPQPAAARIVYTKVNQQLQGGTPVPVDLNHDGIVDFLLSFTGVSHYGKFDISVKASGTNQVVGYCQHLSQGCWASAQRPNVRVGPNERFGPYYNFMVLGGCGSSRSASCSGFGPWSNVQNRYLGFEFSVKGKVHYGWARLNVSIKKNVTAVLTGYAYETVPNKPLFTGKTKGPDVINLEPGSLGQLAGGALATRE
jgi:hypothetical protein